MVYILLFWSDELGIFSFQVCSFIIKDTKKREDNRIEVPKSTNSSKNQNLHKKVRKIERKKTNDKYKRIERMISPEALNYIRRMEFSQAYNSA